MRGRCRDDGGEFGARPARRSFTMCKSTYALCTTAACVPIAGQKGNLNCPCSVHTACYSGGVKACKAVKHCYVAGDLIYSRYYPVKAYAE